MTDNKIVIFIDGSVYDSLIFASMNTYAVVLKVFVAILKVATALLFESKVLYNLTKTLSTLFI